MIHLGVPLTKRSYEELLSEESFYSTASGADQVGAHSASDSSSAHSHVVPIAAPGV